LDFLIPLGPVSLTRAYDLESILASIKTAGLTAGDARKIITVLKHRGLINPSPKRM